VKTNPYEFNIQSKQMNRPKMVSKSKTPVHRHCNGRWKEHSLPGERGDAEGKVTRRIQLDKEGVWMLKDKGSTRAVVDDECLAVLGFCSSREKRG
jgi:hypothetical protein